MLFTTNGVLNLSHKKYTDTHPDTFNKLAVSFSHDVITKYNYYCVFCNDRQSVCGFGNRAAAIGQC